MISQYRDLRGHAVVVADNDRQTLQMARNLVQARGMRAVCVTTKDALFDSLDSLPPLAVILDNTLDGERGSDALVEIRRRASDVPVIVVSRTHSLRQAVVSMQQGAIEFLTKPLRAEDLEKALEQAIERHRDRTEASPSRSLSFVHQILGRSPAILHVRQLIREVAATDATALVIGESGTGKELVARAIHAEGHRSQRAFVPVNMAALPSGLVESVLFGHVKGAFTGADVEQHGCCAQADQGTLFLDEISEMDVTLQAKLLRFLQDQTFQRVGDSETRKVDVRIVAAANQDPVDLVSSGRLREDLYYRLNVFPIEIPPLRARLEDVPELACRFLETASRAHAKGMLKFSNPALEAMSNYTWPGNVRQLENLVERLVIRSRSRMIDVDALPAEVLMDRPHVGFAVATTVPVAEQSAEPNLRTIDYMEKTAIVEALGESSGNVVSAARLLGLGQATVYRKIKRYNISLAELREGKFSDDDSQAKRRA
ncbi:MAG: sigma-54 dependent transcriptional regulator [Pirellulales bacterium]|nr:sigma-54 dependent transcriptional regulator [Pirellulales bacterium]